LRDICGFRSRRPGIVLRSCRDGDHKPVSSFGDGLYVGRVAERLPEDRHVLREVALLDKAVRPDCAQQIVLGNYFTGVLDKGGECVEHLRRQRNDDSVPK
jgi:hypothetical protein